MIENSIIATLITFHNAWWKLFTSLTLYSIKQTVKQSISKKRKKYAEKNEEKGTVFQDSIAINP